MGWGARGTWARAKRLQPWWKPKVVHAVERDRVWEVAREERGEREREGVGGYIKTGAGACQVLRCTQCISVRHRGTPASRKSKYKRVHRRLLLKRKKGARLQNARSRSCPTGKCSCTLIRSNDRCAYVPFGHRATVYPRSACHRQPRN